MSRLAEFRALEQKLAAQLAELEALKGSTELQKEIEFETKLRDLLNRYGFSLGNVIAILDPQSGRRPATSGASAIEKAPRRARQVKQYKNPHSGEVIETKGGNQGFGEQWNRKPT